MAQIRGAFDRILSAIAVSDARVRDNVAKAYVQPASAIRLGQSHANAIMDTLKQHCTPGTEESVQAAMDELVKTVSAITTAA